MKHALSLSLLTLALAGCATTPSPEKVAGLNEDARKTAGGLIQTLGGELKTALTAGGPGGAIGVCKEKAPQIAAEAMQKTGFQIKRVSPKNRNPKGVPDAWETQAQADLEKRLAAGEKPETLDMHAVVDTPDGKVFRYAKALVTQPVCLLCHGNPDSMPAEVKSALAIQYPADKATGYTAGQVRGVLSIRKPL
ncbi:MAG: cytochrome c family protein [bacterium]|nr:MAG: cytochrome c family protein [bacterium]KAF0148795.1 MAG: cytochrome c family protein [bacterium]KAF0167343.1 MAG: cytochrome c family protein [bacterium]TXT16330.1 MAG: cytochrome c family protein [bacterium]